jgi:hypothetical protein
MTIENDLAASNHFCVLWDKIQMQTGWGERGRGAPSLKKLAHKNEK